MTYMDRMNAFCKFRLFNEISHAEADLYYALLHCANRAGWKKNLSIPNSTICTFANITSASQLNKIRKRLIDLGLIKYSKGKSCTSGIYAIIDLNTRTGVDFTDIDENVPAEFDTSSSATSSDNSKSVSLDVKISTDFDINSDNRKQAVVKNVIDFDNNLDNDLDRKMTTYIDKDKDKDKDKDDDDAAVAAEKNKLNELSHMYEENIGKISGIILKSISCWLKSVDKDVISWAISEAVTNNKHSWRYIEAILRNHFNSGRTTLEQINDYCKSYSRRSETKTKVYDDNAYDYADIEKMVQKKYMSG